MTTQKLIKKYKTKLSKVDLSLAIMPSLIIEGKKGDKDIDVDDLRQREIIAKSWREIYIDIIKELESVVIPSGDHLVCANCDGWGYTVDENGRLKEHCKECK